jgi:hypothetical protein
MKTIKSMLPKVKATRSNYYGLNDKAVADFRRLYNYLKKHENKFVSALAVMRATEVLKEENYIDYVRKYKAMEILSCGIL